MSRDQHFENLKLNYQLRDLFGATLSSITFVYGKLLKKNVFQDFEFLWKTYGLQIVQASRD